MKQLNKLQILGIGLILIGCAAPFFVKNSFIETACGVLAAVGISFILKWIPFGRKI